MLAGRSGEINVTIPLESGKELKEPYLEFLGRHHVLRLESGKELKDIKSNS